jgi:hypothetical protein
MTTVQEYAKKTEDLIKQVEANATNIAALDGRVTALEAAGVPTPPSPSPAPEPTPPSPSPAPEPVPPANSVTEAIKNRHHFLPGSTPVAPGGNIDEAMPCGNVELGLGDYAGFTIKNGQCVVGIPYGTRINGKIKVEAGAQFLLRGVMADIELLPGDAPTSGMVELILGSITGHGANLKDMQFISCDGQHDFQDARMHNVEFARAKSHNAGIITEGPAVRIVGRSRADVTKLVFDSYNSLQARNRSLDIQHVNDVTMIGVDDESYEDRAVGPSCNLDDVGIARIMGYGGASGANADGITCTNVDFLTVVIQDQRPDQGFVALNISGAKQAFLVGCAETSTNDNGGTGRIKQRKNCTFETSGQVDPAVLGDGSPWLGWEREVREPLPAFNPDPNAPDETGTVEAMGGYVVLEDRPYRVENIALTAGRIFRGGYNTVLYSTGGSPVLNQNSGGTAGGNPTTAGATILDVRIHGGSEGIRFGEPNMQVNNLVISGVSFSGQSNAGIFVDNTYALDNCHFRCLTFEGPACSIKQRGTDPGGGTGPNIAYIDKVFWDRPQFFGAPIDQKPTRANNLVMWRKGLSENCNHILGAGHNFPIFVGHTFKDSTVESELNWVYYADCDVTLADGRQAFGYGALCEGVTFNLSGDSKPFKFDVPEVWWAYYINNVALNCKGTEVDPEYVNTPSGQKGVSLCSAMSTWKAGSPWQGPKLRYSSLDTKGSQTLDDNDRSNANVM